MLQKKPTSPFKADMQTYLGDRDNNEDRSIMLPHLGIFAISDGMGGHANGEHVAEWCIEAIKKSTQGRKLQIPLDAMGRKRPEEIEFFKQLLPQLNKELWEEAAFNPSLSGGGATLTVVHYDPSCHRCYYAHCGDSRLYHLRALRQTDGRSKWSYTFRQITKDQGYENILDNAMGVIPPNNFYAESGSFVASKGDLLLLTTDGVHDFFDKHQPKLALKGLAVAGRYSPQSVTREILQVIHQANRKKQDNATIVAVSICK